MSTATTATTSSGCAGSGPERSSPPPTARGRGGAYRGAWSSDAAGALTLAAGGAARRAELVPAARGRVRADEGRRSRMLVVAPAHRARGRPDRPVSRRARSVRWATAPTRRDVALAAPPPDRSGGRDAVPPLPASPRSRRCRCAREPGGPPGLVLADRDGDPRRCAARPRPAGVARSSSGPKAALDAGRSSTSSAPGGPARRSVPTCCGPRPRPWPRPRCSRESPTTAPDGHECVTTEGDRTGSGDRFLVPSARRVGWER